MKILCAYSGLQFNVDHFPASLSARECVHPIFYISQKKLLGYTGKWARHELTDTDSYLLFLALLNSTELVEWRVPAVQTARTTSLIANNMESLAQIVGRINLIKHPAFVLSRIAITPESKSLDTVKYWIQNWEQAFVDFETGYRDAKKHDRLVVRESALQKLIKDPNKELRIIAKSLADWAADAGDFPVTTVLARDMKTPMSLSDYWKQIILACVNEEKIFNIRKADLEELIEHCEENIEAGTIYHHALMTVLRGGLKKQINYLGLGDIDITSSTYRILDTDTSVENANKLALIDSAPKEKPVESAYPSRIAYLRARLKYDMAQEYMKLQNPQNPGESA
jgi:hypothetical protein